MKDGIYEFYSDTCAPCKMIEPFIKKLEEKYKDKVYFERVNTDEEPKKAGDFGVSSIPVLVLIKEGQETIRFNGLAIKKSEPTIDNLFDFGGQNENE